MINLYLLGEKGYVSLKSLKSEYLKKIEYVIIGKDKNVENDFSFKIIEYCNSNSLKYLVQNKVIQDSIVLCNIAIGWRWIIKDNNKLIVFHDSILPRLRGFNPLVTSLINGDKEVGVTVLYGSEDFDQGEIILQKKIEVEYPIKIKSVIEKISILYSEALNEIIYQLENDVVCSQKQLESNATYSLWRDEEDYFIDWSKSSEYITRFIDAVGYPYRGAKTRTGNTVYTIFDSKVAKDVFIENRTPGKVLFKNENKFFIVCGEGILCVEDFFSEKGEKIEFTNFRIKFQ